ncbi:polysaccharide deacetylase family protein [Algoriphagus taiwanensis]|uniref:Polysaccharide deacetylase family protein n=1 Tax=Algoriphagus taiwanensis TaxID=1445656 RepID=A0ABQ6Q4D8_9BACT|nr:polysaccharide deacetylase family protein [Algoriphagus taiwanensis]
MVFHGVPSLIQRLFPNRVWENETESQSVFLTFDDGPVPGVTDFVLRELEKRGQKATFFMVGDNVRKNPSLAREVIQAGHQVGNHTHNHLNGWKTDTESYLSNFEKAEKTIEDVLAQKTEYFRPPYGLITSAQASSIRATHQVIMWSVLSGDYRKGILPERVIEQSCKRTRKGSVVVFHDQEKTAEILPKVLPVYLDFLLSEGYQTQLL